MKNTVTLLILFCIFSFNSSAQICFSSPEVYQTGIYPGSICVADFNNDSIPDLAIGNKIGSVTILLGTGTGTFGNSQEFPVGPIPHSVCSGDFNGDHFIDLATSNDGPFNVTAIYGDGTGSFGGDSTLVNLATPRQLLSEDFNGDGFADIAIANPFKVTILTGNGAGQFSAPAFFGVGYPYNSITCADFNHDSILDLAMAGGLDSVYLLFGTGGANFGSTVFIPTVSLATTIISNDVNNDGSDDLITANSYTDNASVFLNNGTGNFSAPVDFAVGDYPLAITSGDYDGDGTIDIAAANNYSINISILTGDGNGNYSAPLNLLTDSFPYAITSADFDRDGRLDIAVVSAFGNNDSGKVDIFMNCSTTGISSVNNENDLSVYPNPTNGLFKIGGIDANQPVQIKIYDLLGDIVFSCNDCESTIDISQHPKGIYLAEIQTAHIRIFRKLILD